MQTTVKEVVAHPVWQQARNAVLAAVDQDGAAVIFGAAGTGKSLLLQDLGQALGQEGRPARLVGPADLLDTALKSHILVVDNAELIGAQALAALLVRDTPFILAARPEFADRLADLPRPVKAVRLRALSAVEVAHFVATRLSAVGRCRVASRNFVTGCLNQIVTRRGSRDRVSRFGRAQFLRPGHS